MSVKTLHAVNETQENNEAGTRVVLCLTGHFRVQTYVNCISCIPVEKIQVNPSFGQDQKFLSWCSGPAVYV